MLEKTSKPRVASASAAPTSHRPFPTRGESRRWVRDGAEPANALSALRLRSVLSGVFAPLFLAGAVAFSVLSALAAPGDQPGRTEFTVAAAMCAVFLVVAVADLFVIRHRRAELSRWGR